MSKSETFAQVGEYDDKDTIDVNSHVPPKWQGTADDRHDMIVMGKKQELMRQFKFSTMLGFASTVTVAWEFVLLISPFALADGGTPAVFWGLLISPIILLPTYASLAEAASMSPTAGGQYHWVSELAPPRYQKGLSYATGWLLTLGWQTFLSTVSFVVASLILGLAVLGNPDYVIQPYHQTLLTMAIVIFYTLCNIFLVVRLPVIEVAALILHVLGVFVIIIPLWVLAKRGSAYDTIIHFTNEGGWSPDGLAYIIGMTPMMGMLIGYDCSVHMSEETKDASRTIPWSLVTSVAFNALLLITVGWSFIFCLGDLESVLATPTEQPAIQVIQNATKSVAGTCIMVSVVIIILVCSGIGQVATTSRQLWSFARDRGMPASSWLERVSPRYNIPINAIIVSAIITCLLSLINLGSYTAFNALNSLGTVSIIFSYLITIGCMTWRRLFGEPLPPRRFDLGRWGLPLNIFSITFLTPLMFFYVWPLYYPVTASNMNWSSTMFGGVLIISGIWYFFRGRFDYAGPVTLVKRDL